MLFVGNNDYRFVGAGAGKRELLVDGKLDVVVLRRKGRIGLLAALVRALTGRTREADMLKFDDVTRLKVGARRSPLRVSCDGESITLAPPLDYAIFPAALAGDYARTDTGLGLAARRTPLCVRHSRLTKPDFFHPPLILPLAS